MPSEINVLDLARGAVQEQINNEMNKILANLVDLNTDTKTVRKLTVTLAFKVDENRESVDCAAQAKATLAPVKAITTRLILDTDHLGRTVAAELNKDRGSALAAEIEKELKLVKSS
ncbi:MAG: hypothetical protein WC364_10625 [Eubacteriales bacterium]|jgi:hypothetical protein